MKKPGGARGWRRTTQTFPCVESNVMVVAASGNECRAAAIALRQLEAQHATVKAKRALKVSDLEMNMTNSDFRVDLFIAHNSARQLVSKLLSHDGGTVGG